MQEMSDVAAELLRRAIKEPLLPAEIRAAAPIMDRAAIEALLPHRDPFLLLDRVIAIDTERARIAARYDLARARDVFAGHFPDYPVWPGVLQIEAIGQAGCLYTLSQAAEDDGVDQVALVHVLGARFMRPVLPGSDVEIVAQVIDDGLFFTVVGQCLQHDAVCSVAAVSALAP
jgi:3-hydroxyacyl-[acyl-carrier-protein] dehydratase